MLDGGVSVVCSCLVSLCRTRFEGYEAAAAAAAAESWLERNWEECGRQTSDLT